MFASDQLKQKVKTEVELVLDDGTVMKGSFFLAYPVNAYTYNI